MSTESTADQPAQGWTILRAGGRDLSSIGIPTLPTGADTPDGAVRLALGPQGEARLLMPIPDDADVRVVTGTPVLEVKAAKYTEAGRTRRFLDLTCLNNDLHAVFAELVSQILDRIHSGRTSIDAASSTIEEFRALLVRSVSRDHEAHEVAGLVGELLYLNRLLDASPSAWRCWRGPAGDRHDFAGSSVAVEVKVTMARGRTSVTINGIEQLEAPVGGRLFLQHFELEAAAGAALSIADLGNAALAKADNPERLKALLSEKKCDDVEDDSWNWLRFRREGEAFYEVGPGFPRLTPSMLPGGAVPPGIADVCYAADLATAAAFRLDGTAIRAIEEQLVR